MMLCELVPGDIIERADERACLITFQYPHPLYPHLALAIWRLELDLSISCDALGVLTDVGTRIPQTNEERKRSLKRALGIQE